MTKSTRRTFLVTAAMTGLVSGVVLNTGCATNRAGAESKTAMGKHDCAGKNDCKGQGGCKTGDNGCKGKNSCKGKGGCKVTQGKLCYSVGQTANGRESTRIRGRTQSGPSIFACICVHSRLT